MQKSNISWLRWYSNQIIGAIPNDFNWNVNKNTHLLTKIVVIQVVEYSWWQDSYPINHTLYTLTILKNAPTQNFTKIVTFHETFYNNIYSIIKGYFYCSIYFRKNIAFWIAYWRALNWLTGRVAHSSLVLRRKNGTGFRKSGRMPRKVMSREVIIRNLTNKRLVLLEFGNF